MLRLKNGILNARLLFDNLLEGCENVDTRLTGNKGIIVGCCRFSQNSKDQLDLLEKRFWLVTFNNCQWALKDIVFIRNNHKNDS